MRPPDREYCECTHLMASHDGGPCHDCNCRVASFDPYLETDPGMGKPRTTTEVPLMEEREPIRLYTDEPED